MICTSIEQSRHLLELGLDPSTADITYEGTQLKVGLDNAITGNLFSFRNGYVIPAWSLSALLEVMPKENEPEIQKSPVTGQYFVYGFFDGEKPTYMTKDYDSPIDAAFEMVCWLLEQGLIEKGGEEND